MRLPMLFGALSLIAVVAVLAGCSKPTRAPQKSSPSGKPTGVTVTQEDEKSPDLRTKVRGADISWDDGKGHRIWTARFKTANVATADSGASMDINDVNATLFKDGKPASTLMAPHVKADSTTRVVIATGGVTVYSKADKATVRADRVEWRARENKLIGTGHVKLDTGEMTMSAERFVGDTELKGYTLTNGSLRSR